jgi:hypothetical protein
MPTPLTRAEASAAIADRTAERAQIQQNLLDLDDSFGKRLLAGGSLAGITQLRWEEGSRDRAWVWEAFSAYSDVVDRAADLLARSRWATVAQLTEVTGLLTGPSVVVTGEAIPAAWRQLTGSAVPAERMTLAQAVDRMSAAYGRVADLVATTESVWTAVSERLDQLAGVLRAAAQNAGGAADGEDSSSLTEAESRVRRAREVLTTDPLSFWVGDHIDAGRLDELARQVQAAAALAVELAVLRADADDRLAQTARTVAAARACEVEAVAIRAEAAQKIACELPAPPAGTEALVRRMNGLHALRSAGRWQELATALPETDRDAMVLADAWRAAGLTARAQLDRRNELRGLLDAYTAKAGRLGAAENAEAGRYQQRARELLWSAPCDLTAAADAVTAYQHAILALQEGRP